MNNDPSVRRIQVFADPAALARAAAEELTRRIVAAVRERGRALVGLSGGSTPKVLYGLLAQEPAFRDRLPWQSTQFFFGDERHVPPDHKDSNYRMAREAMFDPLANVLPAGNVHRMHAEWPDPTRVATEYTAEIQRVAGTARPRLDVILLGMGPEGHTASLFPGTTGLRETAPVASAFIEKVGQYRITFTPPLLKEAAALMFLVAGQDKAEMVATVLEGASTEPDRYPAQGINTEHGETLWLLDHAAAAKLQAANR
jgi:6-phosphogluconolactonase